MKRRTAPFSLRVLLLVGAGLIAALAVAAALLAAWGSARTSGLIAEATRAQHRIELLAQLSARVGEYGLMAMDAAASGLVPAEREARLELRARPVRDGLAAVSEALVAEVAAAQGDTERAGVASRSIGIARMAANFEVLARGAPGAATPAELRARLDGFATLFAPLLNDALEAERRTVRAAEAALARHGRLMYRAAVVIAVGAALLLAAFHLGLVRPLLRRLDRVGQAAEMVGAGVFDRPLPVDRHDELGQVLVRINRMAARLGRARRALERDRARLEEIVSDRTAALSAANDRLEAIDAERRRLFADLGHELRTPLTVILAETDLVARPGAVSEAELREALDVISTRARRLNRRIEDLLRVARSESGQIELDALPFDLTLAAREAMEDVAPLARRAKLTLQPRLAAVPQALGDQDWARQVIAGVIENAIRHSPPGGTIEVAVAAGERKVALSVTDEGAGVPKADRERVFERHMRGERRGPGFGVGLALARWVMTRQGGEITLESPAGRPGAKGDGTRVALVFQQVGQREH